MPVATGPEFPEIFGIVLRIERVLSFVQALCHWYRAIMHIPCRPLRKLHRLRCRAMLSQRLFACPRLSVAKKEDALNVPPPLADLVGVLLGEKNNALPQTAQYLAKPGSGSSQCGQRITLMASPL